MPTRRPVLAALAMLVTPFVAVAQVAPTPITVQVINDSGLPDSAIYLLLGGQDVAPSALPSGQLPYYPFSVSGINTTPAGTVTNTTGALVTGSYTAASASAPLAVTAASSTIAMSFSPATVTANMSTTWQITVPNAAAVATNLVQPFVATLPQGVTVTSPASTGTCGGVTVAGNQLTMANGQSISPGGCTIALAVQATAVAAPATLTASTSYLQAGANVIPAFAPLTVVASLPAGAISAEFAPSSIAVGVPATLTIQLPNGTGGPATLTSDFVNSMPQGLMISPTSAGGSCAGATVTASAVTLPANTSIPANGCTIVVSVLPISTGGALTGLAAAIDPSTQQQLQVPSPYTGQSRPVYEFTMSTVGSGNLYFSYNEPVVYPPAPTVTAKYRFQMLEFSYSQFISSNGDLSSIDFFGIPLELETFPQGDTQWKLAQDRVTYYTSTPSLLQAFTNVHPNFKYAFMRTDGKPWDPATDTMANFARVVGPNQLAAPGTSPIQWPANAPAGYTGTWPPGAGSPWPYPSFADYLDSLVAAGYQFVESDNATISAYTFNYSGTISGNRTAGYVITLVGAARDDPIITLPLPPQATSGGGFDFLIYGIPQNCTTLQVSGFNCTSDNVKTLTNSVYGWIQADVMAALNFGYMNGIADAGTGSTGQSSVWYGMPPVQYPFGQARSGPDGFYSPWAALMYNHSDAYGFAYSDRSGRPSPDIAFPVGGTLRIWILPDTRLDAPLPVVTAYDRHSIALQWPTVAGADHYVVTWSPPYATASATLPQPAGGAATASYTIGGLKEGTPHTVTVRAFNAGATQSSFEVPVYARTEGSPQAPATSNAQAVLGLNWTPPAIMAGQWPTVNVAGTQFTYNGTTGSWNASGNLGIEVGLPPSTAALTVLPTQACSAPCITPSLSTSSIASGGQTTLTITLANPAKTGEITLPHGLTIPLPLGVTTTGRATTSCIGVSTMSTQIVVGAVQTSPSSSSCTIAVGLTSSTPGTVVIGTPATNTDEGVAPAASVALTVTGGASNVAQSFSPASIDHGATSRLVLQLPNTTGSPITLTDDFGDVMPAGVSIVGMADANTCGGITLAPAGAPTQFTMAAGSTIPVGGCTIAIHVTSSTPGTVVNSAGPLLTTATVYPTQTFPMEMTFGGATIWSANLYLTFLGSPAAYSVGVCEPTDWCIGSGQPPTSSFDTLFAPNMLERQARALTVNGGSAVPGPPFGTAMPSIGIPFTPVANKKWAKVQVPAGNP